MQSVTAIDLSGRSLGKRIAVEIQTPENKTHHTVGRLVEWTAVASPDEGSDETMYRAVLTTQDGKARGQVLMVPSTLVWVFEAGDEIPASFSVGELN